ncbi:MAG: Lcl domain-containing protein [Roseateles sp.]|uniref:Lcl domain-containing protein n=1 Tax=Roseateles sp. TaxID=1971397 RepID=UPI0040362F2A
MNVKPLSLPAFGAEISGQGGFFAAILRAPRVDGVEQPPFALIVSSAAAGEFRSAWGEYGKDVSGTTSRTDGKANTDAMALAECPAALRVRALDIEGHTDWYLPSLGELNSAAANVPELFSTDGWYWTSTQTSRTSAFVQDFEYGTSDWDGKGRGHRVRAVRRIQLDLLTA